jgi:hypothetical protein
MKKAIVTETIDKAQIMKIKVLDHKDASIIGHTYVVENTDNFFKLLHNKEIHITLDDTTTIAILKENGKVVKRSEAKLHPDDTFDFETGVNVVMDRLFNRENTSNADTAPVTDKRLHLKINGKDLGVLGAPVNQKDIFGEQLHVGDTVQYLEKGTTSGDLISVGNAVVISNEELVLFNGDKENIQRRNLPFMLSESYTKRKLGHRYPYTDIHVGYLV